MYHPPPFSTNAVGERTFLTPVALHKLHSVSRGSLNFRMTSKRPPQEPHSYSYTGMVLDLLNGTQYFRVCILNKSRKKNKRFLTESAREQ